MQSFRSEIESPIVQKDIIELEQKIAKFKLGEIDEEKFRSLRLARGVYGQRQPGVQMIRIKIPYGKMTVKQMLRIADVTDEYSRGKMHTTTRQDIQIHYVSLDRTPELWADLEKDSVTLREACGNVVRNVTASIDAGVSKEEAFDVSPYAHHIFEFFLRNPVCQEMGRKFKISVSGSESDSAYSFMHDIGLIAKIKDGKKGFKVMVGGGLGAQAYLAEVAEEFLEMDKVIPYIEATLRLFDRYGERSKRHKARLKYLIAEWGIEGFREKLAEVDKSLSTHSVPLTDDVPVALSGPNPNYATAPEVKIENQKLYEDWLKANVKEQKQDGFVSVYIRLTNGDFTTAEARKLAELVNDYAGDDIRISINQGLQLRYVQPESLPYLYTKLGELRMNQVGFDSTADVTACPGTTTCNLGISDSTNVAAAIEEFIDQNYEELRFNDDIKIKISGCMNSCGQHSMASIGFHGSTLKKDGKVMPALQVLLGGAKLGDGKAAIADKVIKVPSKRVLEVLQSIFDDYKANKQSSDTFHDYYTRQGKMYFYDLLKPLAELENISDDFYIDWGHKEEYVKAIGVGECAGVVIDLVQTLLLEVEENMALASEALEQNLYSDSIYHSYRGMINGAKAILTGYGKACNSLHQIVNTFDEVVIDGGHLDLGSSFKDFVYEMNDNEPTKEFATKFLAKLDGLYKNYNQLREAQLQAN